MKFPDALPIPGDKTFGLKIATLKLTGDRIRGIKRSITKFYKILYKQ